MTTVADVLRVFACQECGMNFAASLEPAIARNFWCPAGHQGEHIRTIVRSRWWVGNDVPSNVVITPMAVVVCAACSRPFEMPQPFQAKRYADHRGFRCPRGHSNVYPAPEGVAPQPAQTPTELEARVAKAEAEAAQRLRQVTELQRVLADAERRVGAAEKRAADAERNYGVNMRRRRQLDTT